MAPQHSPDEVQIYADPEERKEMELCHPRCIEILNNMLELMDEHSRIRALDVAGGDGRLTQSLLLDKYDVVDLFDQCPEGVKRAK